MSKSEAVVIESIQVRELLRFLFYLDILNKLSLLQRKHSKYMYAKCLNFPCFITYLTACMHAFCMFYPYVSLGSSNWIKSRVNFQLQVEGHNSFIALRPWIDNKLKCSTNIETKILWGILCLWRHCNDQFQLVEFLQCHNLYIYDHLAKMGRIKG